MKYFKLLFFSLCFSLAFPSLSEVINKIELNGLNSISRGTVLSYLPVEAQDEFNDNISNQILKNLYKSSFFKNISVNFQDGILTINLIENPTIKYFDVLNYDEGNKVLTEELIDKIIVGSKLNIGDIFSEKSLDMLISDLLKLYEKKGFYNVQIDKKISIDATNRIGVELNINENDQIKIRSFKFLGNSFFSIDTLSDNFEIGEPDFFIINYFTDKDLYSDILFEAGIEKITNLYLDNGFLDISIGKDKPKISNDKKYIDIIIEISEGNQYKFGSINFIGETAGISEDLLRSKFNIQKGDFVDRKKVIQGVKKTGSLFRDIGYAFAEVKSTLVKSTKEELVLDLQIENILKRKYTINRIEINGNTKTQDDVIRRELKILESQIYSLKDIDESLSRIRRLGYFSEVTKKIQKIGNSDTLVDLIINVVESKTGEINIGLSHSNSTGASVNAGISQNNIFGTGNTFNAKFTNSQAVEELSFYFKNPKFNNLGHSLSYGYFDRYTDASGLDISSYILNESGFSLGYGIPISEDTTISANTLLSFTDLKCGALIASVSYEYSECSDPVDIDFKVDLSYTQNNLNDFYFATDGSVNTVKTSIGLPPGDAKYWSIEANHKDYNSFKENLVFKKAIRLNMASGYGGDELPFYKRYFEGGSSSIRGFDFNSIGPQYLNGSAKGGELSIVSSLGVSTPLSEISNIDSRNLRLIGFVDAGTISEKFSDFDMVDEMRISTGVQFTWISPIGPIGIYAAKPLLKKSSDTTKTFSFELGSSF